MRRASTPSGDSRTRSDSVMWSEADDYGGIATSLEPELRTYVDEELFGGLDDVVNPRDTSVIGVNGMNMSDDSSALNFPFDFGMLDNTNTDALQADFDHLFHGLPELDLETPKRRQAPSRRSSRPNVAKVEKRNVRSTSDARGVTHHCRTGRYEAHIWDAGKQVYLGGFDSEEQAAIAYDVIAVKCRGMKAQTNFDLRNYANELNALESISKEDLVLSLRRQSKGFSKGSSKFRGVTKHAKGKFEARIGQMIGKKYRYLGLYDTEVEAAVAYDVACVEDRGLSAVTNFDISSYSEIIAEHYQQQAQSEQAQSRPGSKRKFVDSPKVSEAEFRAEFANKHAHLLKNGELAPGAAIARDPSAEAVDVVRNFFAAEARIHDKSNDDSADCERRLRIAEVEDNERARVEIDELQAVVDSAQRQLRESQAWLREARRAKRGNPGRS